MRTLILTLLLSSACVFAADPVQSISAKDKEIQTLLKSGAKDDATKQKVKTLLSQGFTFPELAKRTVPSTVWNAAPKPMQDRFAKALQTIIENASVMKLESRRADSTVYAKPVINGTNATVTATAYVGTIKSQLTYKMIQVGNEWKAWDLLIDGSSTMEDYKRQIYAALKYDTKKKTAGVAFDKVVEALEKKAKSGK